MATDIKNDSNLSTNLVSVWELEEASGTRVDSHGSNDLSDNNTVGQGTGIQGNCADFEVTNGEYLDIAHASQTGLQPSGSFSFAAWIQFESTNLTEYHIFSKFKGGAAADRAYRFLYQPSNNRWFFQVHQTGSNSQRNLMYFTDASISTGTWYHIGVVFDSSTPQGIVYKNGSQLSTASAVYSSIHASTQPFEIGAHAGGASPHDGLIDQACFWDTNKNATTFSDLYNSGSGIPYDAGGGGSDPVFVPKVTMI